jgi:hypothetical protein
MFGAVRMIVGWAVGLGLAAFGMLVAMPYIMDQRCKGRWEPRKLEAQWVWETGCMVKIRGNYFREEFVIVPKGQTFQ